MCNKHHLIPCHNPINCIIPPHMLEVMVMRGDKDIAKMARSMLTQGEKVRSERSEHTSGGVVPIEGTPGAFVSTVLASQSTQQHKCDRRIYDGQNKATLPGKLARSEGAPATGGKEIDAAYDGAGEVFRLYSEEFNRNSLDGNGLPLVATVHHRKDYNNAFWNGDQMAYGDGDDQIFKTFTELSVIGHEMSHGIVQFSGGLVYKDQSGALNESYADVFGSLVIQKKMGQLASEASWLVGEDILGDNINGTALRSMKAPGTAYSDALLGQDPQPYHMDLYVNTTNDNGGVHINSGIPNHAFYLFSQYLGGKAWEIPGQIWYLSLQRINNPHATFQDWAAQTMESAIELHGIGSWEMIMLRRAWKLVGISV